MYVRFDRNVYEYLGNYRRCSWIIALALLYKKPKAIAGGVVILKLYEVLQVLGQSGGDTGYAQDSDSVFRASFDLGGVDSDESVCESFDGGGGGVYDVGAP